MKPITNEYYDLFTISKTTLPNYSIKRTSSQSLTQNITSVFSTVTSSPFHLPSFPSEDLPLLLLPGRRTNEIKKEEANSGEVSGVVCASLLSLL